MSKEIYISTTPHETRLAIVEDEQLSEIYYERENEYTLAGSIYNGKVTRVLPGMQSSFVDVGLERDAFLYVTDFMEEQGDAADFETEGNSRRPASQPSRDAATIAPRDPAPREQAAGEPVRERERRGRGDRDRGSRDRGRTAPEPAGETQIFEEPVAPQPIEESAAPELENEAALDGQGSRRWRGRRGRRRGRGSREDAPATNADVITGTYAEQVEPELLNIEDDEPISLEGAAEEGTGAAETAHPIEIDLSAEPRLAENAGERGRFGRRDDPRRGGRDNRRGGRERGGRGDRDARAGSADAEAPSRLHADPYEANRSFSDDNLPAPVGEPIILPGESIRKYRDPAQVASEEAAKRASAPAIADAVLPVAASIAIVGWDGGAILPGETLSRHRSRPAQQPPVRQERTEQATRFSRPDGANYVDRTTTSSKPAQVSVQPEAFALSAISASSEVMERQIAPTPIPDVEAIAPAAVPEETGGLTQHPAHTDESAAVSPVIAAPAETASTETALEETAPVEYEPQEGESASLGDAARRDYRRLEQRSEDQASDPETIAATPDATVYDLSSLQEPAFHVPEITAPQHTFTSLQPTGEMLSEVSLDAEQNFVDLPPAQEFSTPSTPISQESAIQAVFLQDVDRSVEPTDSRPAEAVSTATVPQVHAYGDGDLQEEEVDGDEYEYDLALASVDDEEFEEYEEETLEGTADFDSVLQDISLDENAIDEITEGDDADVNSEVSTELGTGGFSIEDFGGEPEEPSEAVAGEPATGDKRRGRREGVSRDGRRGSRDRDRRDGGFRGGAGGDRGNGRGRGRQSVQTMDLPAINELLKPGQEILVQIAKEPIAKKGARITSHIALPGRFLVFMPTVNHTGVSRKISSDEERRRLKSILLSEKGDAQGGFIVRTAADGASEEELRNDLRFLLQLWQDIKARSESSKSPALIYHDLSLIERILRDQVTDNFSAIWVDTEGEYERVLRFLQRFQPSLVRRVKLYTKETPLFEHFGVTHEIDKALKSKVWLKSGGSIVINQTEALVAIDINTGKYVGKTARLEDTILKTNLDSIPEIVRQIRLRDLGGIIVIDFIDMDERKNRAKVMQVLEDELKHDRAPSKVLPFNDFGLVIMTRKRVKQSLERTLCIPDPITEGTGMIKSPITVANEIYVEMRKMQRHLEKTDVMLRVHPEVVKQLKAGGGKRLQELEDMTKKTILVKSDPTLNPEQFDIH